MNWHTISPRNRRRFCCLPACLLFLVFTPAEAQVKPEAVKDSVLQMVKYSIRFLTDDPSYLKVKEDIPRIDTCQTFGSLEKGLESNLVRFVQKRETEVEAFLKKNKAEIPLDQARAGLNAIKENLLREITEGKKQNRKNFPAYNGFLKALQHAAAFSAVSTSAPNPPENPPANPHPPANTLPDQKTDTFLYWWGVFGWLGINSLLIVFLLFRKRREKKKAAMPKDEALPAPVTGSSDPLKRLPPEIEQLTQRLEALEQQFIETRLAAKEPLPEPEDRVVYIDHRLVGESVVVRLYGRLPDVPGGFSVSGLTEKPSRPMVFELTLLDEARATFRVANDPDAQQIALEDPLNYLQQACTYLTPLSASATRIETRTEGRLERGGDKWRIVSKAEIAFYS